MSSRHSLPGSSHQQAPFIAGGRMAQARNAGPRAAYDAPHSSAEPAAPWIPGTGPGMTRLAVGKDRSHAASGATDAPLDRQDEYLMVQPYGRAVVTETGLSAATSVKAAST